MGNIGFSEIFLIVVVCLIIFGPSRLPEIGKACGKAIKEFKNAISTSDSSNNNSKTQQ
ncbi:MAG: twin-arginine translocase TatA/TatE family subunit [Pyramidobacter sp.]